MSRLNEKPANPARCHSGFTTIELVVVIVMMGILAAVVAPRMDLLTGFDERGFHDQLKASLQYARKAAVAARHPVCVGITSGAGTAAKVAFSIDPVDPDSVVTINCTMALVLPAPPRGCVAGSVCAPSGVTLGLGSGSASSFAFDALGRPVDMSKTAVGTVTFTIASQNGFTPATTLSASGLPAGVTAAFAPITVTPAAGGSATSTLTLAVSSGAATGAATITVTGESGPYSQSLPVVLTVK